MTRPASRGVHYFDYYRKRFGIVMKPREPNLRPDATRRSPHGGEVVPCSETDTNTAFRRRAQRANPRRGARVLAGPACCLVVCAFIAPLFACEPTGTIGSPPADRVEVLPEVVPPFRPATARMLRLTREQYERSVHDILGNAIFVPRALEPDNNTRGSGFATVESSLGTLSEVGTERYEEAALAVAAQAVETAEARRAWMPCEPTGPQDEACFAQVAAEVGRRLFRRRLADEEVTRYVDLATEAATLLGARDAGAQYILVALLQSPSFLYRAEVGEDRGDGVRSYTSDEMASRLSYFLWDTTPDEALLDAAERDELVDDDLLAAQVDRMLDDERAAVGVRRFFQELLELDRVEAAILVKDVDLFEHVDSQLAQSAIEETLRVVEDNVLTRQADVRELFTTRRTFIDRKLASVYGVRAPSIDGFAEYVFPDDSGRAGVLTHVSILALTSHNDRTSATIRGRFVRARLLCTEIPEPPADVETTFPEVTEGASLRERLREHRENPVCASCHEITDPIGLGLENFDALGRYRAEDIAGVVDASGELDGTPFIDSAELGQAISTHPDLPLCMTTHLYQAATGHFVEPNEQRLLYELTEHFARSGYRFSSLVREVLLSEGFRTAAPHE